MTEPTITCANCKTEIKLTESLAAPLIETTRKQYEQQIAQKDSEITAREAAVRKQQADLTKAQESIDEQVAAKLKPERDRIAAEEAKKARFLLATDLEQRSKEIEDLQGVLRDRDSRLVEAQKAQADLLGVNPVIISDLLGDRAMDLLRYYAPIEGEDLTVAVERMADRLGSDDELPRRFQHTH